MVPRAVLVLDGTPRTIVTISRSLHRRDIPVTCAGIGRSGLGLHSKTICADVGLPADEASFFNALLDVLSKHDVDTVLPCSDKALMLLLPHYDELRSRVSLSCPEPSIVERVLQKSETLALAKRCGIPTPATYIVNDPSEWKCATEALRFPMIAKPAEAGPNHRIKVEYFDRPDDIEEFARSADFRGPFVFQEFVAGEGVGVSTVVGPEGPLALFQHRRLHEYPPAGGVGVFLESAHADPVLANATTTILRALQWRGPAMVEFRRNPHSGDYALMEVNGRFWGSLPLAAAAGFDFPYWQWQIAHGIAPEIPTRYAAGLRVRWTAGEIQRCADLLTSAGTRRRTRSTVLSSISTFASSFTPPAKSALFSIRDPQPELRDVAYTLLRVTASVAWRVSQRILPRQAALTLAQLRLLDPQYRRVYVSRWMLRCFRRPSDNNARRLSEVRRVTFLCRANRIRSPLAAAILERELASNGTAAFSVRSAGTHASSEPAYDPRVKAAGHAMGLSLSGSPRNVTSELVSDSDVIVVMDRMVEAELLTNLPDAATKTVLFGELFERQRSAPVEVPDPDRSAKPQFDRFISDLTLGVRQMARAFSRG